MVSVVKLDPGEHEKDVGVEDVIL
jgi:hypothetical protein